MSQQVERFERATAAFEPVVQRHQGDGFFVAAERAHEQRQQSKRELTEARSRRRSYDGPSLG
ncbi:hypothetical protein [Klebsiella pneumoniae]|uniref:hypothetical protein n=1 Tax=Klebsiella pneumoniae TaxID=573 RepID=UPI0022B7192D|nr:hypothetical protein [Klebsiella pneumoniae]